MNDCFISAKLTKFCVEKTGSELKYPEALKLKCVESHDCVTAVLWRDDRGVMHLAAVSNPT